MKKELISVKDQIIMMSQKDELVTIYSKIPYPIKSVARSELDYGRDFYQMRTSLKHLVFAHLNNTIYK